MNFTSEVSYDVDGSTESPIETTTEEVLCIGNKSAINFTSPVREFWE